MWLYDFKNVLLLSWKGNVFVLAVISDIIFQHISDFAIQYTK